MLQEERKKTTEIKEAIGWGTSITVDDRILTMKTFSVKCPCRVLMYLNQHLLLPLQPQA